MIDFIIPAGVPSTTTAVTARDRVTNGFAQQLSDNNLTIEDVDLVGGFRARLVSLSGEDLGELERIDVRACPVGNPNGCADRTFNLFSITDNFLRRNQTVDLNPTPVNLRELFLGEDDFRLEIVAFPGQVTTVNVEVRLEWEIQAVGDLD